MAQGAVMTAVNEQTAVLDPTVAAAPNAPNAVKPRASLPRRVLVVTLIMILIVSGVALLFQLFEGPFANAWYSSRQRALVADFNGQHSHVGAGRAIALMQIPKLRINLAIAEGDSPQQLRGGPAHRMSTPQPGTMGNAVIVGHQRDWGGPFARLSKVAIGEDIAIETLVQGEPQTAVYRVTSVTTDNGKSLAPFASTNDYRLTLVAGAGDRYSNRRVIVTAISGDTGHVTGINPKTVANTSAGSLTTNSSIALALACFGGAILAYVLLRRRYHRAVWVVVVPLGLMGVISLLFDIDLLLPPLR
jgi:LPXTG-site transpeptidase (sortase) family protein